VAHQVASHRRQHHQAMQEALAVYREVQDDFAKQVGRSLGEAVVAYRMEDAEVAIISMGTIGATAEQTVDELRDAGIRAGAMRVRMFRPFPAALIRDLLAPVSRVAVIDRDISLGYGGVLWGEVSSIAGRSKVVQNYMAGIGGGDVRPHHIEGIITDIISREVAGEPEIMEGLV
jgi:pyruvate/2-oxoacid:ferredoxin oxidoreductase alpha subunit